MRRLFVLAALCFALPAHADSILINNGLAPPNPENVIDGSDDYVGDWLYIRDVGCGTPYPWDPCTSAGDDTVVELGSGGLIYRVDVRDTSTLRMTGSGQISDFVKVWGSGTFEANGGNLNGYLAASDFSTVTINDTDGYWPARVNGADDATITMNGGWVYGLFSSDSSSIMLEGGTAWFLESSGSSSITMNDGFVTNLSSHDSSTLAINGGYVRTSGGDAGIIWAFDSSVIEIVAPGALFEVDGVPVSYGDLSATSGYLTASWPGGTPWLKANVFQGGYDGGHWVATGTIRLTPEPYTALLLAGGLAGLTAAGRRRSLH